MTLPAWFEQSEKAFRFAAQFPVRTFEEHCRGMVVEERHWQILRDVLDSLPWEERAPVEVATVEEVAKWKEAHGKGFKGEWSGYRRYTRQEIIESIIITTRARLAEKNT